MKVGKAGPGERLNARVQLGQSAATCRTVIEPLLAATEIVDSRLHEVEAPIDGRSRDIRQDALDCRRESVPDRVWKRQPGQCLPDGRLGRVTGMVANTKN